VMLPLQRWYLMTRCHGRPSRRLTKESCATLREQAKLRVRSHQCTVMQGCLVGMCLSCTGKLIPLQSETCIVLRTHNTSEQRPNGSSAS